MGNEKRPKIRFPEFTDDWEQRKVSEITKFHKQGFYTTEDYNENKKYYLLRGTDLTENKLILKDTPKIDATEKDYQAFKTEVGDFLIVRSGTVGTYGIVYEDIPAIFGSYLIDFRFDMEQVTNEFFGYFYQSESFKSQLRQIVQQSANTNINAENIKSTSIMLPSIDEQKKIGTYLGQLDNLITLHQRKLESTKKLKKSMLQKMFPKDGECIPEVRFPEFTDSWEQRKVGDTCKINGRIGFRGYTEKDIISKEAGGVLTFSPTNIVDNKLTMDCKNTYITREKYDESPEIMIKNGDVLFVKTGSTLGKSALVTGLEEDASINPQIVVLRVEEETEAFFSNVLITQNILKQVAAVRIGGAVT